MKSVEQCINFMKISSYTTQHHHPSTPPPNILQNLIKGHIHQSDKNQQL